MGGNTTSGKISAVAVVFVALLLGAQVASRGTTECQVPNPSTLYCIDISGITGDAVGDCHERDGTSANTCQNARMADRNQFPDGSVDAEEGATEEGRAKCWRVSGCQWNTTTRTCQSNNNWGTWNYGDKTVDNPEVTCPADEG